MRPESENKLSKVLIPLLVAAVVAFLGIIIGCAVGFAQASPLSPIQAVVYFPPEYPNTVFVLTKQGDEVDAKNIRSGDSLEDIPAEYGWGLMDTFRENPSALGEVVSMDEPRATDIVLQETYSVQSDDGEQIRQVTVYGDGRVTSDVVE